MVWCPEENIATTERVSWSGARTTGSLGSRRRRRVIFQRKSWPRWETWIGYERRVWVQEERIGHCGGAKPIRDGGRGRQRCSWLWRWRGRTTWSPMIGCGSNGSRRWTDVRRDRRLGSGSPSTPYPYWWWWQTVRRKCRKVRFRTRPCSSSHLLFLMLLVCSPAKPLNLVETMLYCLYADKGWEKSGLFVWIGMNRDPRCPPGERNDI